MRTIVLVLIVAAASGLLAAPVSLQDLGPMGPSPYDLVDDWMKPFAEDGYAWGAHTGVFAESPDRIFITQRGELRLPNPVPTEWAGFAGSIGIDATDPEEGTAGVAELHLHRRRRRQPRRDVGTSGITCSKARAPTGRTRSASTCTTRSARYTSSTKLRTRSSRSRTTGASSP